MSGIPQGTLKIIQEYPIIIIFSVIGISSLISSMDLITLFLSFELQSWAVFILALVVLFLLFPVIIIIHFLFMGFISLYLKFQEDWFYIFTCGNVLILDNYSRVRRPGLFSAYSPFINGRNYPVPAP
jgi:hypothetical protein